MRRKSRECLDEKTPAYKQRLAFFDDLKIHGFSKHRLIKPHRHFLPIDDIEKGRNVVRAFVLVLQVIGVFPHIEAEDGGASLFHRAEHQRIVLIRRGADEQTFVFADTEPGPAGAEHAFGGGAEFIFKFIERTELGINGCRQLAVGRASAAGCHDLPEKSVVPVAARVVANLFVLVTGRDAGYDVFQFVVGVHGVFHGIVQVGDVGIVVTVMVYFHGHFVNMRLQCVGVVGQFWQLERRGAAQFGWRDDGVAGGRVRVFSRTFAGFEERGRGGGNAQKKAGFEKCSFFHKISGD